MVLCVCHTGPTATRSPNCMGSSQNTTVIVNIHNNQEFYYLIKDTLPYMDGWKMDNYTQLCETGQLDEWKQYPNGTPTFIVFQLDIRMVVYIAYASPVDHILEEAYDVTDTAALSHLLEDINEWCKEMVQPPTPTVTETTITKDMVRQAQQWIKMKNQPSLMDTLIAVQPMNQPSGKIFYMDYVYGATQKPSKVESKIAETISKKMAAIYAKTKLNPSLYVVDSVDSLVSNNEAPPPEFTQQADKILSCQSLDELSKMLIKLEGKHDVWSEKLKKLIHNRAEKLDGAYATPNFHTAGGKSLPYEATTKIKLKADWKPSTEKKLKWPSPEEMEKISVSMGNSVGVEMEKAYLEQLYAMAGKGVSFKGVMMPKFTPEFKQEFQGHWTSPDEAKEIAAEAKTVAAQKKKDVADAVALLFASLMEKDPNIKQGMDY